MLDSGVNPSSMFQLVQALMDQHKDFDLLLFPRSGHDYPPHGLRRMWDYFVKNLGGVAPRLVSSK